MAMKRCLSPDADIQVTRISTITSVLQMQPTNRNISMTICENSTKVYATEINSSGTEHT